MDDKAQPDSEARCANCRHPYREHTGRSIGYEDQPLAMGSGCEHRLDFRHTCGCTEWLAK
jgi:hypothetical protein